MMQDVVEKKNCAVTPRSFELYSYAMPLNTPLVLGDSVLEQRAGLLVKVQCGRNIGWGEIAPLPQFSQENLIQATEQTIEWLKRWNAARNCNVKLGLDGLYPSVAFGLSCALAEMKGLLKCEASFQTVSLCWDDHESFLQQIQMKGDNIVKIKVGMQLPSLDASKLNMVLDKVPSLRLRLDANRKWSLAEAKIFTQHIKQEYLDRIQFFEEPCSNKEDCLAFSQETAIPIAWDESLRDSDFDLDKYSNVAAIVIKPTLIGSIEACVNLIQHASTLGIDSVISSSIESSFGLTQLARIAQQYTPNTISGLDTLNLMSYQLVRSFPGSTLSVLSLENNDFVHRLNLT